LTSVTVLQTTPWQTTHHAMVTATQVTLDADKEYVLPLHMPFNELKRIKRMALMKQDVLRISQICCARAIVVCGEQFVKFRIIRKIREIRFNSLFLKI